jgi:hypothetical protein
VTGLALEIGRRRSTALPACIHARILPRARVARRVFSKITGPQGSGFLFRLRSRDTRPQARHNLDGGGIEARVGVMSPKITGIGEREPDIRTTIYGVSGKLFGHYADDLERVALQSQCLAHNMGIPAQAANPI